jgi:cellulose synthase/poly-beta-1,6-N-acetylglucosamine synthase-like glycosyltransferase
MLPANFQLIKEEKPGSYAARNTGLRIAKGEIIGFTDSDCIPDKDWITNAVDYLNNNKNCFRIAGHVLIFVKSSSPTIAEKYDSLFALNQKKYVTNWGICVTANLFTYKKVFDSVGLFDDKKMSFGDLNWGSRAHKAGYKIHYLENCIVKHPARNWAELIKKEKRLAGGREKNNKDTKKNTIAIYLKFLKEIRPRLRGEIKSILSKGKNLTYIEKFFFLILRIRLQFVRAYETMKIRLGKQPNRE